MNDVVTATDIARLHSVRAFLGVGVYVVLTIVAVIAGPTLGPKLFGENLDKALWLASGPMPYIINAHGIFLYIIFSCFLVPLFAATAATAGRTRLIAAVLTIAVWLFAGAFGYGF